MSVTTTVSENYLTEHKLFQLDLEQMLDLSEAGFFFFFVCLFVCSFVNVETITPYL